MDLRSFSVRLSRGSSAGGIAATICVAPLIHETKVRAKTTVALSIKQYTGARACSLKTHTFQMCCRILNLPREYKARFRQYVMREDVMREAEVWRCGGVSTRGTGGLSSAVRTCDSVSVSSVPSPPLSAEHVCVCVCVCVCFISATTALLNVTQSLFYISSILQLL